MSAETLSDSTLSAETLVMVAGALLSLAFSYIPGLQPKYDALPATTKRLVMLGLLVLVAGGAYGLACLGWGALIGLAGESPATLRDTPLTCDVPGAAGLVRALILAILSNQATYLISPKVEPAHNLMVQP